jgi:hypothetical protein
MLAAWHHGQNEHKKLNEHLYFAALIATAARN